MFLGLISTDASGNGSLTDPGVLLPSDATGWDVWVSNPIGIGTALQRLGGHA